MGVLDRVRPMTPAEVIESLEEPLEDLALTYRSSDDVYVDDVHDNDGGSKGNKGRKTPVSKKPKRFAPEKKPEAKSGCKAMPKLKLKRKRKRGGGGDDSDGGRDDSDGGGDDSDGGGDDSDGSRDDSDDSDGDVPASARKKPKVTGGLRKWLEERQGLYPQTVTGVMDARSCERAKQLDVTMIVEIDMEEYDEKYDQEKSNSKKGDVRWVTIVELKVYDKGLDKSVLAKFIEEGGYTREQPLDPASASDASPIEFGRSPKKLTLKTLIAVLGLTGLANRGATQWLQPMKIVWKHPDGKTHEEDELLSNKVKGRLNGTMAFAVTLKELLKHAKAYDTRPRITNA